MKIVGLDGKQHNWIYAGKTCLEESHCSHLHLRARVLIKSMFPMDRIMEEVYLPGSDGSISQCTSCPTCFCQLYSTDR